MQQKLMYKIIELNKYDVLLPFVCQKCGACCRGFAPQIPAENLPKIAQHLDKSIEDIRKLHDEAYCKKFTKSPVNCCFLDYKNRCSIYPMRPEPCQLYPLDTDCGAGDVHCGGYQEFHRIVNAFFARKKYAALWSPNSYWKTVRPIPDHQWPIVWKTLVNAQPSNAMIRKFVNLNKVPDHLMRKLDLKHIAFL